MDPLLFLTPDHRWTIWGCNTHQEYLDRFLIKGKFYPDVPEAIRTSYFIVERLIAYSYFHYPMIEEVISKMTRLFEMSVRIRAKSLGITANNLSILLNKLKDHPDIDPEMSSEWSRIREIRNFYAHPESHNFSGPAPLQLIYPMLNNVNRLFSPKLLFSGSEKKLIEVQQRLRTFNEGIFILEMNDLKRLITSAKPYIVSPDLMRSLWHLTPVGVGFPQTMEDYNDFNPIFIRLVVLHVEKEMIIAMDYITNSKILIYSTDVEGNLLAARAFNQKCESADETVKILHKNNTGYLEYFEKQKFIYDEFWSNLLIVT